MECSNEVVLEFVDLYEQEPTKDPNYKNRNAVSDAWKEICKKVLT